MSYILYNEIGQIVSVVSCANTEPDGPTGYLVLPDCECAKPKDFYVVNGVLVAKAPKPAEHMVYDYTTNVWVDVRVLADLKLARLAQINLWRGEANSTSFTYLGKQIACDRLSRSDIDAVSSEMSLTGGFPAGWPGGWKCMDNTYVAITDKPTWIAFLQAMTSQGTANFLKSQTLKAQVAAAVDIPSVEAITW